MGRLESREFGTCSCDDCWNHGPENTGTQLVQSLQGRIKKLEQEIAQMQRRKEIQFKDVRRAVAEEMKESWNDVDY